MKVSLSWHRPVNDEPLPGKSASPEFDGGDTVSPGSQLVMTPLTALASQSAAGAADHFDALMF
jgi:hypothetical protein